MRISKYQSDIALKKIFREIKKLNNRIEEIDVELNHLNYLKNRFLCNLNKLQSEIDILE